MLASYPPVEKWLLGLTSLHGGGLARLSGEYASLFGDQAGDRRIPLAESEYRRQNASDPGFVVATLRSVYSKAGFRVAAPGGGDPDHVSVELEFASLMCRDEAGAWASGDRRGAMRALVRQQLFLSQHACTWLPQLARKVEARGGGLYATAARAAWGMVAHDVDFVRVSKAVARQAAPPIPAAGAS
jgi:TorA maturation chaperone TorD